MRLGRGLAAAVVSVTGASATGGLLGVVGLAPMAWSQEQVMVMRSVSSGGGAYKPVSDRELAAYVETLGFDEGQAEAATMLLGGYQDAVQAAQNERRSAMERAQQEFQDTRDHQVLMEGMQASTKTFKARAEEVEQAFFSDLKSLAMGDQTEKWPQVERARRRAVEMDRGPVSTANVDVIKLTRESEATWLEGEMIRAILDRYEIQLDALLAERARAGEGLDDGLMGGFDPSRLEAMNEAVEQQRQVALRIRQLNDSVMAELLAAAASEVDRTALESAYQKAKFPRVYRESHTERALAAAAGFDDLSEPQRQAVEELRSQYSAQAASLNGRWARELAAAEKSGEESSGGFVIRMGGEEQEESAVEKASKARRELDRDIEARLRDLLDGAQEGRLPERPREQGQQWSGGQVLRIQGG